MTQPTLSLTAPVKMLALGDSYTIGESVAVSARWPEQLVAALRARGLRCEDPRIIATTGWRTDELRAATLAANLPHDYNLVSLLIGVNNQYQGKPAEAYVSEFEGLLKLAIAYAGGDARRVMVVSIPDYGYTPFGAAKQAEISRALDAYNAINERLTKQYGAVYVYITDISRGGLADTTLVAEDGLHPSGKMYAAWVTRMLAVIKF